MSVLVSVVVDYGTWTISGTCLLRTVGTFVECELRRGRVDRVPDRPNRSGICRILSTSWRCGAATGGDRSYVRVYIPARTVQCTNSPSSASRACNIFERLDDELGAGDDREARFGLAKSWSLGGDLGLFQPLPSFSTALRPRLACARDISGGPLGATFAALVVGAPSFLSPVLKISKRFFPKWARCALPVASLTLARAAFLPGHARGRTGGWERRL